MPRVKAKSAPATKRAVKKVAVVSPAVVKAQDAVAKLQQQIQDQTKKVQLAKKSKGKGASERVVAQQLKLGEIKEKLAVAKVALASAKNAQKIKDAADAAAAKLAAKKQSAAAKVEADLAKALKKFESRWRKRRAASELKRQKAAEKKLRTKAKAALKKAEAKARSAEKKAAAKAAAAAQKAAAQAAKPKRGPGRPPKAESLKADAKANVKSAPVAKDKKSGVKPVKPAKVDKTAKVAKAAKPVVKATAKTAKTAKVAPDKVGAKPAVKAPAKAPAKKIAKPAVKAKPVAKPKSAPKVKVEQIKKEALTEVLPVEPVTLPVVDLEVPAVAPQDIEE